MQPFPPDETLLQDARARAAAGAWAEVAHLLSGYEAPVAERPEPLLLFAEALIRSGAPRRALDQLRAALPVLERSGQRHAHRTSLNLLGAASFAAGALDEAQQAWDQALELAERENDSLLVARATNNLGAIANLRGAVHTALYLYQLAVPAYQRLGEMRGLAETYHNLALTYREMGSLTEADEFERRTMELARTAGSPRLATMAQVGRAEVALLRGDGRMALVSARRAADAAEALGDVATRADALRCAGQAATESGALEEAGGLIAEALRLAAQADALMHAEALLARALLARASGDPAAASHDAETAAMAFEQLGAVRGRDAALRVLAAVRRASPHPPGGG